MVVVVLVVARWKKKIDEAFSFPSTRASASSMLLLAGAYQYHGWFPPKDSRVS